MLTRGAKVLNYIACCCCCCSSSAAIYKKLIIFYYVRLVISLFSYDVVVAAKHVHV